LLGVVACALIAGAIVARDEAPEARR
jgi:hypothetical protein